MIDIVKKFFRKTPQYTSQGKQGDESHDIRIATCAVLLEMANIDGEFSESEKEHVISALKSDYGLSNEHAAALLEASNEEREGSIDLWQFTNRINRNYSREEKIQIIETVWEVAYKDGRLDKYEDYEDHIVRRQVKISCADCAAVLFVFKAH